MESELYPTKINAVLIELVKLAIDSLIRQPLLKRIQRGELTVEQWMRFAEQRYLSSLSFEGLLRAGIAKAENSGNAEIRSVLQENLKDELGIVEGDIQDPERSHETWRIHFYNALGLDEEQLSKATPLSGTRTYVITMDNLIHHGSLGEVVGALFVLEGSIPTEFKRMKDGRDKTFKDVFSDQSIDSNEIRRIKADARLYLDDHIIHDASRHYPGLLKALGNYSRDLAALDQIRTGAEKVIAAKEIFYKDLDQILVR